MLPIQKKQLNINYSIGKVIAPEYIVIHETDNENKGANALAHYNYWNSDHNASSSVHFVVDDSNVIQLLELNQRAWHVGDNKGYSNITNSNSIGIEICVNSDGDYIKARKNAIDLVRHLVRTTSLSMDKVVSHNNASGKMCPNRMLTQGLWNDFLNQVRRIDTMPEQVWVQTRVFLGNEDGIRVNDIMQKYFYDINAYVRNADGGFMFETQYLSIDKAKEVSKRLGDMFRAYCFI